MLRPNKRHVKNDRRACRRAFASRIVGGWWAADLPTMQPPMAPAPIADVPLSWFFKLGVIYGLNTSTSKLYSQSPPALVLLSYNLILRICRV